MFRTKQYTPFNPSSLSVIYAKSLGDGAYPVLVIS